MKKLLSFLAPAAVVLLASCSSEPSDWRADKKVSLDMIAPGTRPSDNFDQGTEYAPNQAKGAAITRPLNSSTVLDKRAAPTAGGVQTADTQQGTAVKPGEGNPNAAKTEDKAAASDAPNAPSAGQNSDTENSTNTTNQ